MPKNVKYVKKYRGKIPLFNEADIEKELINIYDPTVKLKSGGYLVINPTEALVSIDINSGQSTKQINIEKTVSMSEVMSNGNKHGEQNCIEGTGQREIPTKIFWNAKRTLTYH